MRARYINPYTDFGFKKLFGEEASKDLLVDFLNELLPAHHRIRDLTFRSPEGLPEIDSGRRAIFDIHCHGDNGERFIVEMQKARQNYFKERTIYYSTFPIREQAEKGDWNFKLDAVYCVGILDFVFDPEDEESQVLTEVKLRDGQQQIFYDKLTYLYIQMPLFTKKENELASHFEKWLYFLKHLEDFREIPSIFNEPVFQKGFQIAELAAYTPAELGAYEASLMVYRDLKGVLETAKSEGEQLGLGKACKSAWKRL